MAYLQKSFSARMTAVLYMRRGCAPGREQSAMAGLLELLLLGSGHWFSGRQAKYFKQGHRIPASLPISMGYAISDVCFPQ
jgi:hypothetical protein